MTCWDVICGWSNNPVDKTLYKIIEIYMYICTHVEREREREREEKNKKEYPIRWI